MGKKSFKKFLDPGGFVFDTSEKPPDPPTIKTAEETRSDAAKLAAEDLRKRRKGGRGTTILTGGLGSGESRPKTLLGQ